MKTSPFSGVFRKAKSKEEKQANIKCTTLILSYLSDADLTNKGRLVSTAWKHFIDKRFADRLNRFLLQTTMAPFFSNPKHQLVHTKALTGGLTNKTIKATMINGRECVARHPGVGSSQFISRENETYNSKLAASLGIAPRIFYDDDHGARVSAFLKDATPMSPDTLKNHRHIRAAASVMRQIHSSSKRFKNDTDVFARNRTMLEILKKNRYQLPDAFSQITLKIDHIEKTIRKQRISTVPCHNDTTPSNFMLSQGKMWMIDWEYSGNNDPLWDLANLSMEAGFTGEQDHVLLEAYFQTVTEDIRQQFARYKPVIEYWVALWAHVQLSNQNCVESVETLADMAKKRFANCMALLEVEKKEAPARRLPSL